MERQCRSEQGVSRSPASATWGDVTWANAAEGGLTCSNYLPQVTGGYRLLPARCALDVPSPPPGRPAPRYLHYDDPPPTLWEQVRADVAREADRLCDQVLELLGACGTLAAIIVVWDWLP